MCGQQPSVLKQHAPQQEVRRNIRVTLLACKYLAVRSGRDVATQHAPPLTHPVMVWISVTLRKLQAGHTCSFVCGMLILSSANLSCGEVACTEDTCSDVETTHRQGHPLPDCVTQGTQLIHTSNEVLDAAGSVTGEQ
jgi:hypothetical protein